MFTCRQLGDTGFVEIRLPRNASVLYGAKISFSSDGGAYKPCAIYRGKDADSLLECSFWDWNEAVRFGNLKFNGRPWPVYWNLYLSGIHEHQGAVSIRVELLREAGTEVREERIELVPCRAVFLDDWTPWVAECSGWRVTDGSLSPEEGKDVAPVRILPKLKGRYAVHFGVDNGTLFARVRMSDEPNRCPLLATRNRLEFEFKRHKEILWKVVDLKPDSAIEIAPVAHTIREPKSSPFGSIRYIKLAPVGRSRSRSRKSPWQDKKLALYFEPYSWAFVHGLSERWQLKEALSLYREMGADEVHSQIIRFGSKTLHHSRVAERFDAGMTAGDDGTLSPGPAAMVRSMDVLKEGIDVCRELGLTHYANAGVTCCYVGSTMEDKISREHPDWRTEDCLRYAHPETRAYAAGVIREFVEWGTDGVTIDCMRYPYYQTEDELLALFREIHEALSAADPDRKVPLTARIPAGDITYFRAFAKLAQERVVQCAIPSTLFMRKPLFSLRPYLKWKDHGCCIFGIIDGWDAGNMLRNPSDIRKDTTRFLKEGADGIFVYQADLHCADAFTRTALNWRTRRR